MSDDDVYEKFEVTDWDLANEFNPNRRGKRQTKESQIYGIWADDDEDNRDKTDAKKASKGKNYTAPISFVSSGVKKNVTENDSSDTPSSSFDEKPNKSDFSYNQLAGMRQFKSLNTGDSQFGKWESHTKGIGAKLLLQMGYKPGKGLGKNEQGIVTPIEAKKRPGFGSIGLYGPEHKPKAGYASDVLLSKKEETTSKAKKENQWKRSGDVKAKVKYVIRSADEVLADEEANYFLADDDISNVKVIDMTGPRERILSGYHQINRKIIPGESKGSLRKSESNFALPELEHNLEVLINMSEEAILKNSRAIRREKERLNSLEEESMQLKKTIASEKCEMKSLEQLVQMTYNFRESSNKKELNVDDILELCESFYCHYLKEYRLYGLGELVVSISFPVLSHHIDNWDPLKSPAQHVAAFERVRNIFMKLDEVLYEKILWFIWMPIVRRSITSWPSMRQCDELTNFIEIWKELLPDWLVDNILGQIIIPRMENEVDNWNPLMDTVPIHSWIHPWLPLMGNRNLETIFTSIRHKLANALTNWHPSDCSAKLILAPWKNVFSSATMEAFLLANIAPKLEVEMKSFVINPHQQRLDVWQWVMSWEDLLPTHVLSSIIENNFLPRWLQVLFNWLSNSPNFDEVSKWYSGWKSMLSDKLLSQPKVKDAFGRALEMMNHSITSPMTSFNLNTLTQPYNLRNPEASVQLTTVNSSLTFKQRVEKTAEDNGILFMPIPNRYHEGKQVYKFGKFSIFIDRTVVFVNINNNWSPTSLQTLLDSTQT